MRVLLTLLLFANSAASAQDSVTAVASCRYADPFFLEKTFVGCNYRALWAMPVRLKVFHANEAKGGLKPVKLGGGLQTKNLHLEDSAGREWSLRSVDKNVDKAMRAMGISNSLLRAFSQQMISAANPYGPLTLKPMADALGILCTNPELYYVTDDTALGPYQEEFANSMCLLEQREPVFFEGDKVMSTKKLRKHLKEGRPYRIDEKMLLQARLLDMLVADWDRHDDQWKWERHKQVDGSYVIYPIPRDHDQIYFNSNGLAFSTISLLNAHVFVGFRRQLKLRSLNNKEWYFDYSLLGNLSEDDWREGVQRFQSRLSDEVLDSATRRLPPEVYAVYGDKLYRLLRIRRDKMPEAAMRYYHFLRAHPQKAMKVKKEMEKRAKKSELLKEEQEADDDDA